MSASDGPLEQPEGRDVVLNVECDVDECDFSGKIDGERVRISATGFVDYWDCPNGHHHEDPYDAW